MTKYVKRILSAAAALCLLSGLFAAPSSASQAQALSVVEAFQTTFRSISDTLLPAVVEVDVTEKKTYTDPFQGFSSPFEFFFGRPDRPDRPDSENDKKDKRDDGKREYEQKGLGSGVIVRRTGDTLYVLTNNHVAGAATKINIKLNDGRSFEAKLVGADERIDVALVSFEAKDKNIPVAKLGDSDSVMPGDICMAFGAPCQCAAHCTAFRSMPCRCMSQSGDMSRRRATPARMAAIAVSISSSVVKRPMVMRRLLCASSSLRPRARST